MASARARRAVAAASDRAGTVWLLSVLGLVFWIELRAVGTMAPRRLVATFTVTSITRPTVGWLLAPLAHASAAHLAGNALALAVYGGAVETHMRRGEYLAFAYLTAVAAALLQATVYTLAGGGGAALGSSGATMGLMTFYGWHYLRHHDHEAGGDSAWSAVRLGLAVGALPAVALQLANDFGPLALVAGTAPHAHLGGAVIGVCYEYLRTGVAGRC